MLAELRKITNLLLERIKDATDHIDFTHHEAKAFHLTDHSFLLSGHYVDVYKRNSPSKPRPRAFLVQHLRRRASPIC